MRLSKLLVVFVVIFRAVTAADDANSKIERRDKVSYSIRTEWVNHRNRNKDKCSCACAEKWEKKVQRYHDGCEDATSGYKGDAKRSAAGAMDSFRELLTVLIKLANTNETITSVSATSILESLGKCDKLGNSSMVMLTEYDRVFPILAEDLENVALKLRDHIGDLAQSFTDAVRELICVFSKYMKEFLLSCRLTGCKKKVCFEPTARKLQKLMSLVAVISDTLLKECDPPIEKQQSVLVLVLIAWYFQIVVQGKLSDTMDILLRNNCVIPENLKSLSISFDHVLVSITQAIPSVVVTLVKTIQDFLIVFINTISALSAAIQGILGVVGDVVTTVGDISRNLFKNVQITSASTDGLIL